MKPRAYFCSCVEGPVPLDHWTSMKCTAPPMPLGWLIGICKGLSEDVDHRDGAVTATRLLTCPRQVLIDDFVQPRKDDPGFGLVFDPRRMNSAHFGTVVHEEIRKNTPGGGYTEIHFPLEGQKPPVLDFGQGVTCPVSGRLDHLRPNMVVVDDYKTHSETAHKFKWNRKAADPEIRAQFGIYKPLIEDAVEGAHITHALVWHGAMTSARHPAPPWFNMAVVPLSLTEIGDLQPFGSRHTVREVIGMYVWALAEIGKITAARDSVEWYSAFNQIVNNLPMVGETMFGGQKCLTYCGAAQPYCFGLAGRAEVL